MFGHSYGTPRAPVMAALEAGRDIISDVDWQGTQQLKETVRDDLVSVFILPPSHAALEERLRRRAQDSDEVVRRAHGEIVRRDEPLARIRLRHREPRSRRQRAPGAGDPGGRARRAASARSASRNSSTACAACHSGARARRIPRPTAPRRAPSASMPAAASSAAGSPPSDLEALAQHLAALAEGGGGDALQILDAGTAPSGARAASGAPRSR